MSDTEGMPPGRPVQPGQAPQPQQAAGQSQPPQQAQPAQQPPPQQVPPAEPNIPGDASLPDSGSFEPQLAWQGGGEGGGAPSKARRIRPWMLLIGFGVILVALGFVIIRGATGGVTYQRVTFTTEGLDAKPVTVSGLLVKPAGGVKGKVPGVVFAHGITGSKEWYIQYLRRLAQEGFVVLGIDLRGHGGSDGACAFACDEANDVLAAGDYLRRNVPEVDPAHITAMGHSLGGVSVTRAGIVQPDDRFSATIAIWCWTSWKDALTDLLGPIDALVGRAWLFTCFSKGVDVNSLECLGTHNILDSVTDSRPPNYLLAIGSADELASVEREEQLMERATGAARKSGPEPKLKYDITYGDFASGTARKLSVTDDDHVAELASGAILVRAIDWIKQDAGIPSTVPKGAPFLWGRILGLIVFAVGVMLLVLGVLSLVRRKLFGDDDEMRIVPPWDFPSGRQSLDVLIWALPLLAASFLAMPAAKALGLKTFIPYAGINEFSTFYLARTLLLLPFFIVFMVFVARRAAVADRLRQSVQTGASRWAKSLAYGLIPLGVMLFVLLALAGPLLLPRVFARLPLYFFLGVACIGAGFWLEDYLFYKLAYSPLETEDTPKQWKVLLVRSVVLDLALMAALLPLMKGPFVTVHLMTFRLPLLLLLALATPMFIFLSAASLKLRKLTGGSLAFALMLATIWVWFLTGPIGTRGF